MYVFTASVCAYVYGYGKKKKLIGEINFQKKEWGHVCECICGYVCVATEPSVNQRVFIINDESSADGDQSSVINDDYTTEVFNKHFN